MTNEIIMRKLAGGENVDYLAIDLKHGSNLFCITKGQVSIIDIISCILSKTGPVKMLISMWTIGIMEIAILHRLFLAEKISDIYFILDRSFATRCKHPFANLIKCFGQNSLRILKNHSKIVLLLNNDWAFAIRGSMNLNKNIRIEHFDISENRKLVSFIWDAFMEIFKTQAEGVATIPGFQHDAQLMNWANNSKRHYKGKLL